MVYIWLTVLSLAIVFQFYVINTILDHQTTMGKAVRDLQKAKIKELNKKKTTKKDSE